MNPVDDFFNVTKDVLFVELKDKNKFKIKRFNEMFFSYDLNEISDEELDISDYNFEDLGIGCRSILGKLDEGYECDLL